MAINKELIDKYKHLRLQFSSSDGSGCGYIRSVWPMEFLSQYFPNSRNTIGFPAQDPENMNQDVFFLQRIAHEFFYEQFIPWAQANGKRVVIDMDDNLWEIPSSNLAHRHYGPKELRKVSANVKAADAVVCSTVPLANYIKERFNENVFVIENMNKHYYDFVPKNNEIPKVGWGGSYTHNGDFDNKLVQYIIDKVKAKQIEFHLFGFIPQYFKNFCVKHDWSETNDYQGNIHAANLDIGIIVAPHNVFNECKSNIKWIEYSCSSIASVADDTYPYTHSMEHGKTGFLVKNHKTDWREYIDFLINNPDERQLISKQANEVVKNNFTYQYAGDKIVNKYTALFEFLYEGIKPANDSN